MNGGKFKAVFSILKAQSSRQKEAELTHSESSNKNLSLSRALTEMTGKRLKSYKRFLVPIKS